MQRKKNKDSDYDSPQVIEVDQFGREIRPDTRASGFSTRSSMRDSPIRSLNGTRGVQKSPIPTNRGNMRSYDDFETSLRRETSSFDKRKAPPPPASSYIDNPDREEDFYRRSYPESSKHRYEDDDLRPSQQQRTSASMNSSRLYDEPYQSSRPPTASSQKPINTGRPLSGNNSTLGYDRRKEEPQVQFSSSLDRNNLNNWPRSALEARVETLERLLSEKDSSRSGLSI